MTRTLWAAVALATAGIVISVYSAIHTTSLSMLAFAFLGLPAIGGAMALYFGVVLADLRQKDVL